MHIKRFYILVFFSVFISLCTNCSNKVITSKNLIEKQDDYLETTKPRNFEEYVFEGYQRMKYIVRVSHIFVICEENTSAEDTLTAFTKITKIRKRIINGEDFNQIAKHESEYYSAESNLGDLGYLTAFDMVYPFETAAYNTPVGSISEIIKSKKGYHILKVIDRRPNKGKVKVAHLLRAVPNANDNEKDDKEKKLIHQLYDSIIAGTDFKLMVERYSDDKGTNTEGGELPVFGVGRMVLEFEKAAFELKEIGDISKPIRTNYGYHIIKLIEQFPLGSFEEERSIIEERVKRDNSRL